jgi:hypothetical protein
MSADKYAQFIAEQQKKLSVSGTNPVNLIEKKELSDKQKDIAKLAGDEDEIESEDLKKLRDKKDDDKDDDKKSKSKKEDDDEEDKDDVKEEFEQIDELTGKGNLYDIQMKHLKKAVDSDRVADVLKKRPGAAGDADQAKKDAETSRMKANRARILGIQRDKAETIASAKKKGKQASTDTIETHTHAKRVAKKVKAEIKARNEEFDSSYISEEESDYLAEMVAKGKLPEIADFHKKAADHALKMRVHHQGMADKSEDVGDHDGFEHHIDRAMRHDYEHEHPLARYDHAVSLKARNQAMKDLKVAKDKAAKARDAKRDWA